jgi:hypothetical protein
MLAASMGSAVPARYRLDRASFAWRTQAGTRAAAILVDELDAGQLKSPSKNRKRHSRLRRCPDLPGKFS